MVKGKKGREIVTERDVDILAVKEWNVYNLCKSDMIVELWIWGVDS